jgi:hypothetical protein
MSQAMSRFFRENNDSNQKSINLLMPANIRWELYPTIDKVKMENKFAPV